MRDSFWPSPQTSLKRCRTMFEKMAIGKQYFKCSHIQSRRQITVKLRYNAAEGTKKNSRYKRVRVKKGFREKSVLFYSKITIL